MTMQRLPPIFRGETNERMLAGLEADIARQYPAYLNLRQTDPLRLAMAAAAGYAGNYLAYLDALLSGAFIDTAIGGDLDALAAFFTLTRNDGETDESFRTRIKRFITQLTPIGSQSRNFADARSVQGVWDASFARSANLISQAYVIANPQMNGGTPQPTQALRDAVLAYLSDPRRARLDQIWECPAPTQTAFYLTITATYANSTESVASSDLNEAISTALLAQLRLGRGFALNRLYNHIQTQVDFRGFIVQFTITQLTTTQANATEVMDLPELADNAYYWCPVANRTLTLTAA